VKKNETSQIKKALDWDFSRSNRCWRIIRRCNGAPNTAPQTRLIGLIGFFCDPVRSKWINEKINKVGVKRNVHMSSKSLGEKLHLT
jgi:hypothetical protein